MADFPNVPDVPGVPSVPRDPRATIGDFIELVADAAGLIGFLGSQQWGIFLDGEPVVFADTVISVDYKQGWTNATYPLEQGAFETYDKVAHPFDVRVRLAAGGSLANRQAFLASLDEIGPSLDIYDVVTPEKVFTSVNVAHITYDRKADRGLGLIMADVFLEQIRVNATAQFSNTGTNGNASNAPSTPINTPQSASAAPQTNDGTVQPVTPSTADNSAFIKNISDTPFNF
jgi:hypothetical protein